MSDDVTNVHADRIAIGASRLRNMSRRPAVSIAAIAPAVAGNTAKSMTISTEAELATQVVIPKTTPIDSRAVRSSITSHRGVMEPAGRSTDGSRRYRADSRGDQDGRDDGRAHPQFEAGQVAVATGHDADECGEGDQEQRSDGHVGDNGHERSFVQACGLIVPRWRFRLRHRVLLGCVRTCASLLSARHGPGVRPISNSLAAVRGRFAPSPTGPLHLGNLRTALVAWLMARRREGGFIVRMEDLDRVTSSPAHEADQLASLRSIGLDWDGDVVRQSERFDLYREAIGRLQSRDLVYECYCTRREIRLAAQAPQGADPDGSYPGTCRHLTDDERAIAAVGRSPAGVAADERRTRGIVRRLASAGATPVGSTTSCCNATTACLPTTWRSWSTMPRRVSPRSCAATICWRRRRGRSCCIDCSICHSRSTPTCRWCSPPMGRASPSATAR